jgi:hypothetical protein
MYVGKGRDQADNLVSTRLKLRVAIRKDSHVPIRTVKTAMREICLYVNVNMVSPFGSGLSVRVLAFSKWKISENMMAKYVSIVRCAESADRCQLGVNVDCDVSIPKI